MAVAVVQSWPVRVAVGDGGVVMLVLVPDRGIDAWIVRVIVMPVVVPVEVTMTERWMRVGVVVPLALPNTQRQRYCSL